METAVKEKLNLNKDHREGKLAKAIEKQTAKLPSDLFLWTALGCMGVAATCKIIGKDHLGLFIGQWAAPFLLFGIYDKMVKLEGHDKHDK